MGLACGWHRPRLNVSGMMWRSRFWFPVGYGVGGMIQAPWSPCRSLTSRASTTSGSTIGSLGLASGV
eukprot:10446252-Prorocentrum_lima.AAC.1